MWVLALDTATPDLVTGLVDTSRGESFDEVLVDTRKHNELLVPTVQALLQRAGLDFGDLDAIVVGCGPGPFTGLRVGMATASAFGQALGIPVHGVVTHDAIAAQVHKQIFKQSGAGRTLVVTDARRREVYWALYEQGVRVDGPDVIAPAELAVEGSVDVISVPAHLADALQTSASEIVHAAPTATSLVDAADLDAQPAPLVPLYLRRPDAKEPAAKPKSPAIPEVEL